MDEKVYFCRSAKEFKVEEMFNALGPLMPAEEDLFSHVRNRIAETPRNFLDDVRITLLNPHRTLKESANYVFLDYFPDCFSRENRLKYLESSSALSFYKKVHKALDYIGFTRKNFKIDDRIEYLHEIITGGEDLYTFLITEYNSYETYENNPDLRINATMEYLKDILPPFQYDIFKFFLEHDDTPDISYTKYELELLKTAEENIKNYHDDIINLILF